MIQQALFGEETDVPRRPYTAEEEARILETFAPQRRSPEDVLGLVSAGVGVYRLLGQLRALQPRPRPKSEDVRRVLDQMAKSSDSLTRLILGGPPDGHTYTAYERGVHSVALHWLMLTPDEYERVSGLLADLVWFGDHLATVQSEHRFTGRPRKQATGFIDLLVVMWLTEHGRKTGDWWWSQDDGSITGPIGDFVRACTEPVLTPEEQRESERILHGALKSHAKRQV